MTRNEYWENQGRQMKSGTFYLTLIFTVLFGVPLAIKVGMFVYSALSG